MGLGVGGDEVLDEGGEGVLEEEIFECHTWLGFSIACFRAVR